MDVDILMINEGDPNHDENWYHADNIDWVRVLNWGREREREREEGMIDWAIE